MSLLFQRLSVYLAEFWFCLCSGDTLRDKMVLLIETASFHVRHHRPGRMIEAVVRIGSLRPSLRLRSYGGDMFIFHEVLRCRVYDFPSEKLPQAPRVILDLGANIGLTTLTLAARFPDAHIVCVEPHPENARLLRHNLRCLEGRVTIIEAAVSDRSGMLELALDVEHYNASLVRQSERSVRVEVLTPEDVLRRAGVEAADLVKMDIEGTEHQLLVGKPAWLKPVQVLLAELHGPHQKEMIGWLEDDGFHLQVDGGQVLAWR